MATITGDSGNNILQGTSGNDSIDGLAGEDQMTGLAGNDTYTVDNTYDAVIEAAGGGTDLIQAYTAFTLPDNVENLTLMGADPLWAYGNVLANVLTGNAGNNRLTAGDGNDSLLGLGGNDELYGDAGNDTLSGGTGSDYLSGGDGLDQLDGGSGADQLSGEAGDDKLYTGVSNVVLNAAPSAITFQVDLADTQNDMLLGGSGSDTLLSGAGSDYIDGGDGANVIYASGGNDTVYGGISNYVDVGDGNDSVFLGSSAIIKGGAGNDYLQAADNLNLIDGGSGDDWIVASGTLTGGTGNDLFRVDLNPPTLYGPYVITDFTMGGTDDSLDNYRLLQALRALGFDGANVVGWLRIIQNGANAELQVDKSGPGDGAAFQTVAVLQNTTAANLTGADFAHYLTLNGSAAAGLNQTVTAALLDRTGTYMGKDGNDTLTGLAGQSNQIDGGLGNDVLNGQEMSDILMGDFGNDALNGGGAADLLIGGTGNDTLSGGSGNDAQQYVGLNYKGNPHSSGGLYGEEGNDVLNGGDGDDYLSGGTGNDQLNGDAGDDYLYDQAGADTLHGGAGNDYIQIESGNDQVFGDAGNDQLNGGGDGLSLDGGDDQDVISLSGSGGAAYGGLGQDTIYAHGDNNQVDGGDGNDLIDIYYANSGLVAGGAGDDLVTLHTNGSQALQVNLGDGADRLVLESNQFDFSNATVTTGAGSDQIVLSLRALQAGYGATVLTDFTTGSGGDRLDITAVLGRLHELGYDYSNPFTQGWMRLLQSGANTLLQVDLNGSVDGGNWLTLAQLNNVTASAFDLGQNLIPSMSLSGVVINANSLSNLIDESTPYGGLQPGDGNDVIHGNAGNDTLSGGFGGADYLEGGADSDVLFGFSGNDLLFGDYEAGGAGSSDALFGGSGDDTLYGGAGDDNSFWIGLTYKGVYYGNGGLYGDDGNDVLYGGTGLDNLDGGQGNDLLLGEADNDYLTDYAGMDTLRGGDGNDSLYSVDGNDRLYGDAGNDTLYSGGGDHILMDGGADNDHLSLYGNDNTLLGGSGQDYLYVSGENNLLDGGADDDEIHLLFATSGQVAGGAGNDVVTLHHQGSQGLLVNLGDGNDRLNLESQYYDHATATVTTGAGADEVQLSLRALEAGDDITVITDFTPGAGGDRLDITDVLGRLHELGYDYSNPFTQGWLRFVQDGSNTLLQVDTSGPGNGGNWQTLARLNNVTASAIDTGLNVMPSMSLQGVVINADASDNTIDVSHPYGGLQPGDGNDVIRGNGGNDLLSGGFGGADLLVGGDGRDIVFGFSGNDILYGDNETGVTGDTDALFGGAGDDTLYGGGGDDNQQWIGLNYQGTYYSSAGLYGEEGNDALYGGYGNDAMDGGTGDDLLAGEDGDDYLVDYAGGSDTLSGGAGNDQLQVQDGHDVVEGGDGQDNLYSANGDHTVLDGGNGDDNLNLSGAMSTLVGGLGADTFYIQGDGNTVLAGEDADSIVIHYAESGLIDAGSGNDQVALHYGGARTLWVELGAGDDHLITESSPFDIATATVTTGAGADEIMVSLRSLENDKDSLRITDFTTGAGGDRIDIAPVLGRLHELGYDYRNPFTTGWLRLAQNGADTLLQVDTNGAAGGGNWRTLAVLDNVTATALTRDNFVPPVTPAGDATIFNLTGDGNANELIGREGNDSLSGGGGSDLLDGDFGGDDTLVGGAGQDLVWGYAGNDVLYGDTQDASFVGDSDGLWGGFGNDTLYGGDGNDNSGWLDVNRNGLHYSNSGLYGEEGNDVIFGGDGQDYLDGGSGNDSLNGDADNDILLDYAGADTLNGGAGDDFLNTYDGNDRIYGGAGNDTVYGSGEYTLIDGGDDNDTISHYGGHSTISGGLGMDTLQATEDDVVVDGGDGNDTITINYATTGQITGGAGSDTVSIHYAGSQNLSVNLGDGDDSLSLEENSYMRSTARVTTGTGRDTVLLSLRAIEDGRDITLITDFTAGALGDRLDLSAVFTRLQELGWDGVTSPFTAGYLRLSRDGSDTAIEARVSGTTQLRTIAILQNVNPANLVPANFVTALTPVASSNYLPTAQASKTIVMNEDAAPVALGLTAPVDPDGGTVSIVVDQLPPLGVIRLADNTEVTSGQVLTASQLTGLTFTPGDNVNSDYGGGENPFRYSVIDNEGSRIYREVRLHITPINDAPVVVLSNPDISINEDDDPVYLGAWSIASISDVDAGNLAWATVRISGNYTSGDLLSADTTGTVFSASFNAGTGVLTVTGAAPAWQYKNFLSGNLLFSTTAESGASSRVISFKVNDGMVDSEEKSITVGVRYSIEGTAGNDTVTGTAASDFLVGWAGNDLLNGLAGSDTLRGGLGNDTYVIDGDLDTIVELPGEGSDTILSSRSNTISLYWYLNVENLELMEGGQTQYGYGNDAANLIRGNSGANWLDGNAGADTLIGGAGDDTYVIDSAGDLIIELAGGGTDTVYANVATTLQDNVERLILNYYGVLTGDGNAQNNELYGNESDNLLRGMAGNDLLTGNGGVDTLQGGGGNDTYLYESGDQIIEAAGEGSDTLIVREDFNLTTTPVANVENVTLAEGWAGLQAWGDAGQNILTGNSAANMLDGKAGADTLIGGAGDDTYWLSSGDVVVELAGEGVDEAQAGFSLTLADNVENLVLTGSANVSGIGNSINNLLTGNSGANLLDGRAGADTLAGGAGNDTYVLSSGDVIVELAGAGIDEVQVGFSFTLAENLERLLLTGSANASGTGNAAANMLTGNSGANVLSGGLGNDTYEVGAGDTVIEAADSGVDQINASVSFTLAANVEDLVLSGSSAINGTGNALANRLTGNSAVNSLSGGAGDDTYLIDGADTVTELAGGGMDTVVSTTSYTLGANVEVLELAVAAVNGAGNSLDNRLTGNDGANTLTGDAGNDWLSGGLGADTLLGGLGNDTYVQDGSDTLVELAGEGSDTVIVGTDFNLTTTPLANIENLQLAEGSAGLKLWGDAGLNVLTGNSGANTLDGKAGVDTLIGGSGNDTYLLSSGDVVMEMADGGVDEVQAGFSLTLAANVERLVMTGAANASGTGNALANTLLGNSGNNGLDGGAGADTLTGGLGNDTYGVDDVGDVVTELAGEGTDLVKSSISYVLGSTLENLTLTGISHISGTGNSVANVMAGNDGDNLLDGKAGADTMNGGLGNDTYVLSSGDVVTEGIGAGIDWVQAGFGVILGSNVENLQLTGAANASGYGNSLANILNGNSGNNLLDGKAGADTMSGGLGNDTYLLSSGDVVTELAGEGVDEVRVGFSSTLAANVENLLVTGTANASATGNELANVLTGNSGANRLAGGLGNDSLTGGAGNDSYVLSRGDGADTITDTDATAGNTDRLWFNDATIAHDQLWFRQSGNDLEVSVIGTADKALVKNWYISASNRVEEIRAGNGKTLLSVEVDALVSAMSGLTPPALGQTTLDASQHAALDGVIAANWS